MKQSKFEIKGFFAKYQCLTEGDEPLVPDPDEVEEVQVGTWDDSVLNERPRLFGAVGSLVDIDDDRRFCWLDCEGRVVGEVKQERDIRNNYAHQPDEVSPGETVGESLLRVNSELPRFLVEIRTGYTISEHHSVGGYRVVLTPVPAGVLTRWLDAQLSAATQKWEEVKA